jgi:hypothetical protein
MSPVRSRSPAPDKSATSRTPETIEHRLNTFKTKPAQGGSTPRDEAQPVTVCKYIESVPELISDDLSFNTKGVQKARTRPPHHLKVDPPELSFIEPRTDVPPPDIFHRKWRQPLGGENIGLVRNIDGLFLPRCKVFEQSLRQRSFSLRLNGPGTINDSPIDLLANICMVRNLSPS